MLRTLPQITLCKQAAQKVGVSSSGGPAAQHPTSSEEANVPPLCTTLLEPHPPLSSTASGLCTGQSDPPESVTEADSSGRILGGVAGTVKEVYSSRLSTWDLCRVDESLCTFHHCCCSESRDGRCQGSCHSGSLQANCSIVYSSPSIPRAI